MKRATAIVVAIALIIVAGIGIILATTDIPPPSGKIEKAVPDDRLPR
jgi:hypothetical protein